MPSRSLQKQISIFLPIDEWRRLRGEAARLHVPITELCRTWIRPGLRMLECERDGGAADAREREPAVPA